MYTKINKYKAIIIEEHRDYIVADVGGREYLMSHNGWDRIKDKLWYWYTSRTRVYPIWCDPSTRTLKSIIHGGRCYTISNDMNDLRDVNLMRYCRIDDIDDKTIRVHVGNGKSFIADSIHREYISKYKWSLLELKPGYPYVCRFEKLDGGKRRLVLLHRYVAGVTQTSDHVDHLNWDTCDNRLANLNICTLYENVSRHNPNRPNRRNRRNNLI